MSAVPPLARRIIAVGCDIQTHSSVADSLEAFGPAYLRRMLHPQERVDLGAPADALGADPQLTARVSQLVALKESVMKCLGLKASDPMSWIDIECTQVRSRPPVVGVWIDHQTAHQVRLHGSAALYARRRGIRSFLATASTVGPEHCPAPDGGTEALATARALALSGRCAGGGPVEKSLPEALVAPRGADARGDIVRDRCAVQDMATGAQHRGAGRPHGEDLPSVRLRAAAGAAPARQGDPSGPPEIGGESMSSTEEIIAEVRQVVAQHAHLAQDAASLAESDSLYAAGMTSHASVNVMLGVEDAFDLEFPEQMLTKETFESLESIAAAVRTLEEQQ